jgi:hypothetical protein
VEGCFRLRQGLFCAHSYIERGFWTACQAAVIKDCYGDDGEPVCDQDDDLKMTRVEEGLFAIDRDRTRIEFCRLGISLIRVSLGMCTEELPTETRMEGCLFDAMHPTSPPGCVLGERVVDGH